MRRLEFDVTFEDYVYDRGIYFYWAAPFARSSCMVTNMVRGSRIKVTKMR